MIALSRQKKSSIVFGGLQRFNIMAINKLDDTLIEPVTMVFLPNCITNFRGKAYFSTESYKRMIERPYESIFYKDQRRSNNPQSQSNICVQ